MATEDSGAEPGPALCRPVVVGGNHMKKIMLVLILLLALGHVQAGEVRDGNALLNRPADRTYDDIIASGYLKVGVYRDFPPYSWEEDGEPQGIDVELGRRLAEGLGVAFRVHWVTPDETLEDDLRNNVWKGHYLDRQRLADVMLRVPYDTRYAYMQDATGEYVNEQVVMLAPYQQETWQIAFDPARLAQVNSLAVFRNHPIGVEIDTLPDFYLSSVFRGQLRDQVRHYRNVREAFAAMEKGEVSGVMGMRAEVEHELARPGKGDFRLADNGFPGIGRQAWDVGMAIRQNHRQLGYALEAVIDRLVRSGEMAALFREKGLSYSVPGYYREFLEGDALARAEGRL